MESVIVIVTSTALKNVEWCSTPQLRRCKPVGVKCPFSNCDLHSHLVISKRYQNCMVAERICVPVPHS